MPINSNLSCVAFDEMSLQEYINQCRENVSLEGLEDFGSLGKTNKNATSVLVFMARGLTTKWKYPLWYFLSNGPMDRDRLARLLLQCISKLSDVGLIVKCIVSVQGQSNQALICKSLKVGVDSCSKWKDIFVFFDPPYQLKSFRNNLKN